MNQEKVIEQLKVNIKAIYHKAVDADKVISAQQADGLGQFDKIFVDNSPFSTESDHFLPYVEELANDLLRLQQSEDEQSFKTVLEALVVKIELAHKTLASFKQLLG
ncbi:hypothetical protein [Celerinatantimonas sp. MCCC 1A17872]|uniref:hypothetical protein n=1 Tax=Celerinatantimonas sp. MCCC 1A17872 TaxID=3177514 RepID=UPI0038C14027